MKSIDFLLSSMGDMEDDFLMEANDYSPKTKKRNHTMRIALIAAAVAVLLAGAVYAVYQYTRITDRMAARWENLGQTEMAEAEKEYVEDMSSEVGYRAEDQGIVITADSVTCTESTLYVLFHIEMDPEQYNPDKDYGHIAWGEGSTTYVENEEYGTAIVNGGGGMPEEGDGEGYWSYRTYEFDLPKGARLNDGKTVFHTELTLLRSISGSLEVSGNWTFEFLLPEGKSPEAREVTVPNKTLTFSDGNTLEISEIEISENIISFCAATTKFTTSDGAVLLDQQMEEFPMLRDKMAYYLVEGVQEDGTIVPTNAARYRDDGSNQWEIHWAAPINPTTVSALRFSNGAEEIEIQLG